MRYFIFLLCVICTSCGFSNRHITGQEKTVVTKDTVRVKTEPVAASRLVIDTISGLAVLPEASYVFNPSMVVASGYPNGEYMWSQYPHIITSWIAPTGMYAFTVDSVSIPPVLASVDTISAAPVKFIPKATAAILPEPKSSSIPYIVCGIAAVILSTLFFAFIKRVRKTK